MDSPLKVLVMDDEVTIRNMVAKVLSKRGCKVSQACDGADAVRQYRACLDTEACYDVLILDVNIPYGLGGQETIRELKNLDPEVKAIVSSGNANDPIISEYQTHGFSGFLPKPFHPNALLEIIHTITGKDVA